MNARDQLLKDWLDAHDARCMWQQRIPRIGMMECWQANGRVFLIQHYKDGAGFEVYIPSHSGNNTRDSLGNAAKYIRGEL